jgi:hypothetical protein
MSYKPGDFLIGVSELVSIVLPGAIATYALTPALTRQAAAYSMPVSDGAAGWVAFIVLAYLIGHLIFLIGSFLDMPYDWLRQRLRPREKDGAYLAATRVATKLLGNDTAATNTYKYATALLALRHETASIEVRQFEADSKFFRSLTVLVGALMIAASPTLQVTEWFVGIALLGACFWRYCERRWKATRRAFEYLVTIQSLAGIGGAEKGDAAR